MLRNFLALIANNKNKEGFSVKKKALVLAICLAISAPTISLAKSLPNDIGFNLGDIQSSSTVGQHFSGVIPVLFTSVDEANQLKIKIAPHSIFQKVGIERLPFLDNLHFKIGTQKNKPVVHISSSKPIDIPFIDFIIEVTGPKGVVYQDYTILIDPPNYKTAKPKPVTAQQVQTLTKNVAVSSPKLLRGKMLNYEVLAGDKLTDIAAALKTSQNSLKRMIDIIHHTNPNAFVNNDIRQLKSGVFLKIPSANQISNFKFKTVNKTKKSAISIQKENIKIANDDSNETNTSIYTVKKGDTLSQITQKFTHKGISFTKRMHSIFNANPHAFSNSKINVLKIGSKLTIPYADKAVDVDVANTIVEETEKEFLIDPTKTITTNNNPVESSSVAQTSKATESYKTSPKKPIQKVDVINTVAEETEKEFLINPTETITTNNKPVESSSVAQTSKSIESNKASSKKIIQKIVTPTVLNTDNNSITKNSVVNKTATANSAETIKNLEKRVRELRNNLTDSRAKLTQLEKILVNKNIEIKKKRDVINSQKSEITELEELLLENEENKQIEQLNFNSTTPLEPKSTPLESKTLNTDNSSDSLIVESIRDLTFDNVSLGFLALFLGLGLITYRKELYYTYAAAKGDYPKFYPPENDEQTYMSSAEIEEKVEEEEPEIELTTRIDNDVIISNEELKECDALINEITNDLNTKEDIATDNNEDWNNLEKICDDYIEKFKEEQRPDSLTDTNLDLIENTAALNNQDPETSFEDIVSDLINNLDDKSKFAETDDVISDVHDEEMHDFGILIDTKKKEKMI